MGCVFWYTYRDPFDAFYSELRHSVSYSWIVYQLDIGALLGRRHNYLGLISNLWPFLDSSDQTTQDMLLDFCEASKQEGRRALPLRRGHDIIERTQISLTSLTNLKTSSRTKRDTSERPETSIQEYVFDERNPINSGSSLLGPYFHIFWKIRGQ